MKDYYSVMTEFISQQKPGFRPKIGLILGSGLGSIADDIENKIIIYYSDIPHFPQSTVKGHKGQLVLGALANVPVVCMQGRIHGYEGATAQALKIFIRILKILGCESLIITNAAGSLKKETGPGELSLITDHINMQHRVPLMGPNDEEFGGRFFAMNEAYDAALRKRFITVAQTSHLTLHQGVYIGVTGPCFETPAEIRAFRLLGADLIGMSTVPEVIIARHCGLRVAAISAITNYAAGMTSEDITHEETLHFGKKSAHNLSLLIKNFLASIHHEPC